ncbi:hypothetical protein [Longimicrobium terrae]|uniref:RagB/SusD domain-containing protein n=1 Tax=Longimicrobium terrae TaxID=1639882 RepID=A0A841GY24_9BACT|nr:hypothetical protein [Longimicrobium terrae]MBB4636248.1 hypothetical protein [Longimicrobium terrae]MBB6070643.1 hypothetical protein [Longimicrobium terrae]NNC29627.1 hypothetical protein [Longimicrobium terrae]
MNKRVGAYAAALASVLGAACADLDVTNSNSPPAPTGDPTPVVIESLLAGSFRNYHLATHSEGGITLAMSVAADEHTSSAGNFAMIDFYQEPRRQIDNFPQYSNSPVLNYTWDRLYLVLSSARTVMTPISRPQSPVKVIIAGEDNTIRAKAFARFMQGIATGVVASTYDRGYRLDETTPADVAPTLLSHDEMLALSLAYLDEAITLANGNSFQIPAGWIPTDLTLNSAELARLAHSYKARFMAWEARTPAERAAVNWDAVITETGLGITDDFNIIIDDVVYANGLVYQTLPGWGWWDLRYAGMAETTGNLYQAWAATPLGQRQPFRFGSLDARFPATTAIDDAGLYVYNTGFVGGNADRGTYNWSEYGDYRWSEYWEASDVPMPDMTAREIQLLRAEGMFRKGNLAGAVAIINETRVGNGELPPVTTAGIPDGPSTCVPQLANGQCGNLFEALKWEKRTEVYGITLGDWFFDSRGWGDLIEGTPIQFPIPPKESAGLGLAPYTFGGVGGNCSAGGTCVAVQ